MLTPRAVGNGAYGPCEWFNSKTGETCGLLKKRSLIDDSLESANPRVIQFSRDNACGGGPGKNLFGCGRYMCSGHLTKEITWSFQTATPVGEIDRFVGERKIKVCDECYDKYYGLDKARPKQQREDADMSGVPGRSRFGRSRKKV